MSSCLRSTRGRWLASVLPPAASGAAPCGSPRGLQAGGTVGIGFLPVKAVLGPSTPEKLVRPPARSPQAARHAPHLSGGEGRRRASAGRIILQAPCRIVCFIRSLMSSNAPLPDATPPLSDAGSPPAAEAWAAAFAVALPYEHFLDRHATPEQKERWSGFHARVELSDAQQALLGGFVRRMPVLVLAGTGAVIASTSARSSPTSPRLLRRSTCVCSTATRSLKSPPTSRSAAASGCPWLPSSAKTSPRFCFTATARSRPTGPPRRNSAAAAPLALCHRQVTPSPLS